MRISMCLGVHLCIWVCWWQTWWNQKFKENQLICCFFLFVTLIMLILYIDIIIYIYILKINNTVAIIIPVDTVCGTSNPFRFKWSIPFSLCFLLLLFSSTLSINTIRLKFDFIITITGSVSQQSGCCLTWFGNISIHKRENWNSVCVAVLFNRCLMLH